MATSDDEGFVRVATLEDLEDDRTLVTTGGQSIAIFRHDGELHAVDNRCPHMGFPLARGSVEDGVLTCHWHHARFELSCGSTFDPFADDVPSYPIELRDDEIWVDPHPEADEPPRNAGAAGWRTASRRTSGSCSRNRSSDWTTRASSPDGRWGSSPASAPAIATRAGAPA